MFVHAVRLGQVQAQARLRQTQDLRQDRSEIRGRGLNLSRSHSGLPRRIHPQSSIDHQVRNVRRADTANVEDRSRVAGIQIPQILMRGNNDRQIHQGQSFSEIERHFLLLMRNRQRQIAELKELRWDLMWLSIQFLVLFILMLLSVQAAQLQCSRDMLFWLVGYVGLYLTKLVLVMATFYTTLKSSPKSQILIYTKYLGLNLAQVAMLAYGNYIYFSAGHEQSCFQQNQTVNRLQTIILIILIIGYTQIAYFLVMMTCILAMITKNKRLQTAVNQPVQNQPNDQEVEAGQRPQHEGIEQQPLDALHDNQNIQDRIRQITFSTRDTDVYISQLRNEKFHSDNDKDQQDGCSICLLDFQENDSLLILNCHQKHFFHYKCGQEWLRTKPECPLCRHDFRPELMMSISKSLQSNAGRPRSPNRQPLRNDLYLLFNALRNLDAIPQPQFSANFPMPSPQSVPPRPLNINRIHQVQVEQPFEVVQQELRPEEQRPPSDPQPMVSQNDDQQNVSQSNAARVRYNFSGPTEERFNLSD